MEPQEIARWRLQRQGLEGTPFATPEQAVGWLGAMQAQEYTLARWSVGQRTRGADEAAIEGALAAGAVLRTHVLRPTWHFVLPADIRWMVALTAPRVKARVAPYDRRLGLDDATLGRSQAVIALALAGGRHCTRQELAARLAEAGLPARGQALGQLLMHAELDGLICSGAMRGKQQTYALLEERAPGARSLSREEALAELTRRYFASRGPATLRDYRAWCSLTAAEAQRGLEAVGGELAALVADERTYYHAAGASLAPAERGPSVHLLQGYDEYVMGYSESHAVLDVAGLARTTQPEQTPYTHVLIIDGQAAARWRRTLERGVEVVEAQPLRPLGEEERTEVEAEVARFERFLGRPAALRWAGAAEAAF